MVKVLYGEEVLLPLVAHSLPYASVHGLADRAKAGFQFPFAPLGGQLSLVVLGGANLRPKLKDQLLEVPAVTLCTQWLENDGYE